MSLVTHRTTSDTALACLYSKTIFPHFDRRLVSHNVHLGCSNLGQATRTIIFNTKSHLGLNFGVLISWIALLLVVLPSLMWWAQGRQPPKGPAPAGPGPR
jgi:hypothetical protein